MKQLPLFFFLILFGLISCQQVVPQKETMAGLENFEKNLPAELKTDSSFLAFKDYYLYLRDYTGTRPGSTEMAAFLDCLRQHTQADGINIHPQIDTKPEFISYMLGYGDIIPDIVKECNLDGDLAGNYLSPIFHMQSRVLDLFARYEELQNESNIWAALYAELDLPEVTPEYWRNR